MTIKKLGKLFAAALFTAASIFMFTGCESYFIKDNIAEDFPEERPVSGDINYKIHYSVVDTSDYDFNLKYSKKFRESEIREYGLAKKRCRVKQQHFRDKLINPVFKRNKLYLNKTFKNNADYYLDIDFRKKDIYNTIFITDILGNIPVFPIPSISDRKEYYVNIDVYDRKPNEFSKPIAMYEYKRTARTYFSVFLLVGGGIPMLVTGHFSNMNIYGPSDKTFVELQQSAYNDMLLEFTDDLKKGKTGNIVEKTIIPSQ